MTENKFYLPKIRTGYILKDEKLRSFSPKGDSTFIPNPATDPIVVNNIAWQEFDYTEDLDENNSDL
jgi:hypothetical protein